MKRITPDVDLQHAIQKDRILESKEYYRGKSFNYASEWHAGINYFNDQFTTDFISFNGAMLACKQTHVSSSNNMPDLQYEDFENPSQPTGVNSKYWDFVMAGTPGPHGQVYKPAYNESTGELTWNIASSVEDIKPIRIKGEDAITPKFELRQENNTTYLYHSADDGRTYSNLGEVSKFTVGWAESYEKLPPAKDHVGQIYVVGYKGDKGNLYSEYLAVHTAAYSNDYMWEKIGDSSSSVNLDNYFTKKEVEDFVTEQISSVENIDGGEIRWQ